MGDSPSISSTLDDDTEDVWEIENASLLAANVAAAVVLQLWSCSSILQLSFFESLFTVDKLIPVFTLFTSFFSLLKNPFLEVFVLCLTLQTFV